MLLMQTPHLLQVLQTKALVQREFIMPLTGKQLQELIINLRQALFFNIDVTLCSGSQEKTFQESINLNWVIRWINIMIHKNDSCFVLPLFCKMKLNTTNSPNFFCIQEQDVFKRKIQIVFINVTSV